MWGILRKKRLGCLCLDSKSKIIFQGDRELPSTEVIFNFLDSNSAQDKSFKNPPNFVIRDRNHLDGWLETFLRIEKESLSRRFDSESKSYECIVFADSYIPAVDIEIRLKTVGINGYTKYTISIAKLEEDDFLCVE
jgi:hypothetical protein